MRQVSRWATAPDGARVLVSWYEDLGPRQTTEHRFRSLGATSGGNKGHKTRGPAMAGTPISSPHVRGEAAGASVTWGFPRIPCDDCGEPTEYVASGRIRECVACGSAFTHVAKEEDAA